MQGSTHLAAGILTGVVLGGDMPVAGGIIGGIAGLLPDIDHPRSMISRRIPILPWIINLFAKHRGATHTLWFCLGIAGVIYASLYFSGFTDLAVWASIVVFGGTVSHLVLDSCTKSGVYWLAPWGLHLRGGVKTGDIWIELPLTLLFLGLTAYMSGFFSF